MRQRQHTHSYTLTAGESNAEGLMPLTLLVERIIEVATEHANNLNIGYATLIKQNIGWVLSRLSIEMHSLPRINDSYTFTTWIESYNRHFSERNFAITGHDGKIYGYARTIWMAMDFATRSVADLSSLEKEAFPTAYLPCPIDKAPRIPSLTEGSLDIQYTFKYCDLDFNRHVNTVRYIELLMNRWTLDHYDKAFASRFDIIFHRESHYNETVTVKYIDIDDSTSDCSIVNASNTTAISARFKWKKFDNE